MTTAALFRNARILTMGGAPGPRRGPALADPGAIDNTDVLVEAGRISAIGPSLTPPPGARIIDARSRVLMPSFVDCHTHAMWAGSRLDEWERRLKGVPYLDILREGGGIMSTVRAVRAATREQLAQTLRARLDAMLREGTTTAEVKSGYGLTTEDELKMLRAIADAAAGWPGDVVPTALIAHAIDPDQPGFVRRTIDQTLPAVAREFPGITIDAYCESGAWSLEDCIALFQRAAELGCPCRVHADQFNAMGMTEWAAQRGFLSVDHLEASGPAQLDALARSDTFAVALPCSGLETDQRFADCRALADRGAAIAIATNCNPGTAPTSSMPLAIALAARRNGLTPSEAITCATVNAAALLRFDDRAFLAPGARADLVLLRHTDERCLAWEIGGDPVRVVMCAGRIVRDDGL